MAATTIISGSVITVRAAVAGISGPSTSCMMTNESKAQPAVMPNFLISSSDMRLASRVFTSIALRMKARMFSQITSSPSTASTGLVLAMFSTTSMIIRTSEVI